MAGVLLVEDDPSQLEIRKLLLELKGFTVHAAGSAAAAMEIFREQAPDSVVMDLRLPAAEDGRALIRGLSEAAPGVSIVVLSGWTQDLENTPEAAMVSRILRKPVRGEQLLSALSRLALLVFLLLPFASAQTFPFSLSHAGEAVAGLTLAVPGCDWETAGREGALLDVSVDGAAPHQVMLFAGGDAHLYPVFLGPLGAGAHQLHLSLNPLSAPGCRRFEVRSAAVRAVDPKDLVALHAPILSARADTVGRFSDAPMLLYATREDQGGQTTLEYTYIFTNEDGGTNTRDLMARWGRTTDIEFVYRVVLKPDGSPLHALIQAKDHKEIEYEGPRLGWHPYLQVSTDNNMVEAGSKTSVHYQLAPRQADLARGSREVVMDADPVTYAASAKEMSREGKLRPNGAVEGFKIADPRRYVVVEFLSEQSDSHLQVLIELDNSGRWFGSARGIDENLVPRSGWARLAIELPPGKSASDITGLGFQCMVARDRRRLDNPETGLCVIGNIGKVFQLQADYTPGPSLWTKPVPPAGWTLPAGQALTLPLR